MCLAAAREFSPYCKICAGDNIVIQFWKGVRTGHAARATLMCEARREECAIRTWLDWSKEALRVLKIIGDDSTGAPFARKDRFLSHREEAPLQESLQGCQFTS